MLAAAAVETVCWMSVAELETSVSSSPDLHRSLSGRLGHYLVGSCYPTDDARDARWRWPVGPPGGLVGVADVIGVQGE